MHLFKFLLEARETMAYETMRPSSVPEGGADRTQLNISIEFPRSSENVELTFLVTSLSFSHDHHNHNSIAICNSESEILVSVLAIAVGFLNSVVQLLHILFLKLF